MIKAKKILTNKGFTLIEVIITFIVLSVVIAMMAPFFGTNLTQSSTPMANLRQATSLQAVMENIISDSDSFLFNGQSAGPTSYANLQTLQTRINANPGYGTYTVVQNGFITTLGDAPNNNCAAANNTCILQVTISDTKGETLTSLFTIFITAL